MVKIGWPKIARAVVRLFAFVAPCLWFGAALAVPVVPPCGPGQYDSPSPIPPEKFAQSPGGVDMRTGRYAYSHTDLEIGGERGVALTRIPPEEDALGVTGFGWLTHNWRITVNEKRINVCTASFPSQWDYLVSVNFGARSETFRTPYGPSPGDFWKVSGGGFASLDFEYTDAGDYRKPIRYIYRSGDGWSVEFRPTGAQIIGGGDGCGTKCAYASKVVEPDGTTYSLSYDVGPGTSSVRLRSVVSNRGHALLLDYAAIGSGGWRVSKACVLNLAQTALPAATTAAMCPVGAKSSTYSYTAAGSLSSFVDQGGVAASISKTSNSMALFFAGSSAPYLTNTMVGDTVQSQQFADGRTFTYSWNHESNWGDGAQYVLGGSYTDPASSVVSVTYAEYRSAMFVNSPTYHATPGPVSIVDELGRETVSTYCGNPVATRCDLSLPLSVKAPEGDMRRFEYDGRRNVTRIRHVAKSGSGLADRNEYRSYACTVPVCMAKPTSETDANGNVTNYTWSTVHGGVLTETGPAVGGVRPQKRYFYAQRYAWIKSGSGYVQASSPVWVLTSEEYCRTTAASGNGCAGGAADEVVTTYDYGPNSGPNNLWLRGVAVTADGQTLRTCSRYDGYGRKISETSPNANLSSCP